MTYMTTISYYDCVLCQKAHFERDAKYKAHIRRQSKHGVRYVDADYAVKLMRHEGKR